MDPPARAAFARAWWNAAVRPAQAHDLAPRIMTAAEMDLSRSAERELLCRTNAAARALCRSEWHREASLDEVVGPDASDDDRQFVLQLVTRYHQFYDRSSRSPFAAERIRAAYVRPGPDAAAAFLMDSGLVVVAPSENVWYERVEPTVGFPEHLVWNAAGPPRLAVVGVDETEVHQFGGGAYVQLLCAQDGDEEWDEDFMVGTYPPSLYTPGVWDPTGRFFVQQAVSEHTYLDEYQYVCSVFDAETRVASRVVAADGMIMRRKYAMAFAGRLCALAWVDPRVTDGMTVQALVFDMTDGRTRAEARLDDAHEDLGVELDDDYDFHDRELVVDFGDGLAHLAIALAASPARKMLVDL